jgi:hypothetical protein
MNPEKLGRKKILVEIFEQLPAKANTSLMLERANAILTEAGQRDEYKGSIALQYANEAFELINDAKYEEKKDIKIGGLGYGTLKQYCQYLLERARDNYTNETAEGHADIAEQVREFVENE